MKFLKLAIALLAIVLILGLAAVSVGHLRRNSALSESAALKAAPLTENRIHLDAQRYRLDASQSKFIAHAMAGGLLWFKGHDHLVAVREFGGEAQLTPDAINPASLEIIAKSESMVETSSVFTDQQKQIIDKELREIVLQPAQYPDIVFRSTQVSGKKSGADQYDLNITGDLTLHGVTRPITIPTKITLTGNELRAVGEFSIERSDFKVKATSAVHGLVRVRDKIKFTFDIVGHRI
jgi:polyisoprenoid-binding protein YceI